MTTPEQIAKVASKLARRMAGEYVLNSVYEDAQKVISQLPEPLLVLVKNPVRGVISGLFCCSSKPEDIDILHTAGVCSPRFEPNDYSSRGYAHAARLTSLGLAVREVLMKEI